MTLCALDVRSGLFCPVHAAAWRRSGEHRRYVGILRRGRDLPLDVRRAAVALVDFVRSAEKVAERCEVRGRRP